MKSKANQIVDKLTEADLDDPKGNVDRHGQDIFNQRRFGGKMLAFEPEDVETVGETHFDCWSDSGDEEDEPWDEFDPRSVKQAALLAKEWAMLPKLTSTNRANLKAIVRNYPHSGLAHTMLAMAHELVEAGYSVYLSDTRMEIYDPATLSEEQNVSDDEEGFSSDTA